MTRLLLLTLLALASLPASAAELQPFEARVVGVADGDTITVLDGNEVQLKIRLGGIDAPEKGQRQFHRRADPVGAPGDLPVRDQGAPRRNRGQRPVDAERPAPWEGRPSRALWRSVSARRAGCLAGPGR